MSNKHSISVISNSCGVKAHTLRIWEKRYGIFTPDRSLRGQRLYSDEDLFKANLLSFLVNAGHSISSLSNYSIEKLQSLQGSIRSEESAGRKSSETAKLKIILEHMENYKIDLVADELGYARTMVGAKDYILNLILPVIRETGALVEKGKYSVTQEHIISSIIRDQISQINLPNLNQNKSKIVLATPEGNLHEFSILIANILCRINRLSTSYLGAAHPATCLAEAINVIQSTTLILGVVSSDDWEYEKNIISYLTQLDKSLSHEIRVILGGGHHLKFPQFKKIKELKILKSFEEFDKYLEEQL